MRSREIHGDGLSHEADYVRERLEDASDTSDYAAASDKLKEELRDLQSINSGQAPPTQEAGSEAGEASASTDEERMRLRQGSALDVTSNSVVDVEQQPPEAEARAAVTGRINERGGR